MIRGTEDGQEVHRALRILLLGFGNIGRAFCEIVEVKTPALREKYGIECRFVGIATRSRGCATDPNGIDVEALLKRESSTGRLDTPSSGRRRVTLSASEMVSEMDYDLLVVCTSTTIQSPEIPKAYIRGGLERGKDVITSNKGPLFLAYRELNDLAAERGTLFLFEAAVMGGTPFFSFARHSLVGSEIISCEGVMNTTSNYILDLMVGGSSFDDALLDARRKGFAEADPTFDLEGWDSAVKASIIAQVLMGAPPVSLESMNVQGINKIKTGLLLEAARSGGAVRLVSRVEREEGSVSITVRPEVLPPSNPLSRVHGATNGVLFLTDTLGEIFVAGGGIGPKHTAYSMLRDLIEIAVSRKAR
ncbi:MAG TPA: homoserine dehydrogenase [Synergistales bacterium]|nr:homoserine dehydrogenase [Synergistales bacterium]